MSNIIPASFQSAKVVPDLITVAPRCLLGVHYCNNDIDFGQELTPTQVKDMPVINWNPEELTYYTLCMSDLDGRLPNTASPVQALHWLVTNIPGKDLGKGETLTEYVGSAPPKDSGLHRYVFLLYKQREKMHFEEKHIDRYKVEGRLHFSIQKFAEKYYLGVPVAGNMYRAQYDDYVPLLRARFT